MSQQAEMEVQSLILDRGNPLSVVNKVASEKVRNAVLEIPLDILAQDEKRLKKQVEPTELVNMLRINFWRAYEMSVQTGEKFSISDITQGVCLPEYFHHQIVRNHLLMAWILKPPKAYMNVLEEALTAGVDRLREILELPIVVERMGKDGNPIKMVDTKVGELILKTVVFIDARVKGSIVQRSEVIQKSMNVSMHMKGGLGNTLQEVNMADLDKKLADLEARSQRLLPELPQEIIVEAESVREAVPVGPGDTGEARED